MPGNVLYYGDNLDLLRRYIKDETVDLVYLDPPHSVTFKQAPKATGKGEKTELGLRGERRTRGSFSEPARMSNVCPLNLSLLKGD